jgi:hypothetical protein
MRRVRRVICNRGRQRLSSMVFVVFAVVIATSAVGTTAASAQSAPSARKLALAAIEQYRGAGKVRVLGGLHVKGSGGKSHHTSSGSELPSTDQLLSVEDNDGSFTVDLSVIEGSQTVVDIVDTSASTVTSLVLAPGTSTITQVVTEPLVATPTSSTNGGPGCWSWVASPTVIGSYWGPLMLAQSLVSCSAVQPVSVATYLQEQNGKYIASAGYSTTTNYLVVNAYAPCYAAGGQWFTTWGAFAVSGYIWYGNNSAVLGCASL